MQGNLLTVLIVTLAAAMVTSAPLSNQEKLFNVEQVGDKVNREKRAEEEIVFGNQQNKARVVAKKSDLSNILAPAPPPGEVDQGSEVIVHKEVPVSDELAARAEAASGSASENNEKMKEAVEAALQSVAEDVAEKTEAAATGQAHKKLLDVWAKVDNSSLSKTTFYFSHGFNLWCRQVQGMCSVLVAPNNGMFDRTRLPELDVSGRKESANKAATDDNATKQLAEDDIEENEQGTGEVSDAVEENAPDNDDDDEAEILKELQQTAENNAATAAAAEVSDGGSNVPSPDDKSEADEVEKFLQESQQPDDGSEIALDRDRERTYVNQMRNYLMSLNGGRSYHRLTSPYIDRYRRSLSSSRKNTPSKSNKRARRIKRDLLDDRYYGPYELPYVQSEYPDLNSDSEDFVPLTDDEAQFMYKQLVNYLANEYTPEPQEQEQEEGPLDSYLNGYEEDDNEPFVPYSTYNEDVIPYVPSTNEENYQYEPLSLVDLSKRGMIDYYPFEEEEKRYFFPFNKEPETHWGAFVPEKRDYGEAIQRLQRLAMALSDNPGPYYREILEEYRRK